MTDSGNGKRLEGLWLAFSPDTPEEQAAARFTEKHGYPPQEVHRSKGLLLVGPIGESERKWHRGRVAPPSRCGPQADGGDGGKATTTGPDRYSNRSSQSRYVLSERRAMRPMRTTRSSSKTR